ncbi:hypothetical protein [Tenuibacillus multivorans]|uniref:hypothetical protein n=1 Tax=Tenuibacillus multivorans TaxID=237069 RepID=UPI00116FE858|nr:hypothetical protein [Tenuibacillus multivorans]GEL76970.1 hypothetical protein TMU01_12050 [Tenuibacillus multivorans]
MEHGYSFEKQNGIYEIVLDNRHQAEEIAELLPNKFSEMFVIEQISVEEIFKQINSHGG